MLNKIFFGIKEKNVCIIRKMLGDKGGLICGIQKSIVFCIHIENYTKRTVTCGL